MGIDALTVRPVLSTRYKDDAPKIMPRIVPTMMGSGFSSERWADEGMYGSNAGGFVSID